MKTFFQRRSSSTKSVVVLALLNVTLFSGCYMFGLGEATPMHRDEVAFTQFSSLKSSYEPQFKQQLSDLENKNQEIQTVLKGISSKMQQKPDYKATIGKYEVVLNRKSKTDQQVSEFLAWVEATSKDPINDDVNKFMGDSRALMMELNSVSGTFMEISQNLNSMVSRESMMP